MSEPIVIFIRCSFCGDVLDQIEVAPGERWDQAEKWGYIATKAHEPVCPGRTALLAELVRR